MVINSKLHMSYLVVCPGYSVDSNTFCDCDSDCTDDNQWCSCPEAQACCKSKDVKDLQGNSFFMSTF